MKSKPSKLDQFADKLDDLLSQGGTLADAQSSLAASGCSVSLSRLSNWWADRRGQQLQARLLTQITTGARQCRDVEASFGQNPAPALETIIKLHRVLALQLATASATDPAMIDAAERATKMALEFAKLEAKRSEVQLATDKFQFDAATACLKLLPELKAVAADNGLTEPEKVQEIRRKLFGVVAQ